MKNFQIKEENSEIEKEEIPKIKEFQRVIGKSNKFKLFYKFGKKPNKFNENNKDDFDKNNERNFPSNVK